jgi:DNA-directed RNA polymerase specialized sigma24 family protein
MDAIGDRAWIARAVSGLSAEHEAALHRCFYRGWTVDRTAAEFGITSDAVKSRLHDALWLLRTEFTAVHPQFAPTEDNSAAPCCPRKDLGPRCA